MRELLDDLDRWRAAGQRVALARVVEVAGSGPREPGAALATCTDGEIAGSVSGGCVDAAVLEAAADVLAGAPAALHTFGCVDGDELAVGLTCGGTVRVFVEPLAWGTGVYEALAAALRADEPVSLATAISGPHVGATLLHRPGGRSVGSVGDPALDAQVSRDAAAELRAGRSLARRYDESGASSVFLGSFAARPRMIIFGAVDFTAALVRVAHVLGFHVTVCDARPAFATPARFPFADEVRVDWPQRHLAAVEGRLTARDAVCVLTHDLKFDVPAIAAALRTDVGYIGVMGSRRTHRDRLVRLREAGVDDTATARLHAPIGLDLGARTPEETAVSICAEIISARTGRADIRPLMLTAGPIHDRPHDQRLVGT